MTSEDLSTQAAEQRPLPPETPPVAPRSDPYVPDPAPLGLAAFALTTLLFRVCLTWVVGDLVGVVWSGGNDWAGSWCPTGCGRSSSC